MNKVDCRELSLKKIKINADIIGKFGTFDIEQTYKNNKNKVLEVFYTFPIVETATIAGFEVIIGDKVLKGKSTEKTKAKKKYQKNIVKGNSAYLLEQKSENIFTIVVGKLDKNEEVKIKIKYIDKFEIVDNEIHIFIPTIITPKYKSKITQKLNYGKVNYSVDFKINIENSINAKLIKSETNIINITKTQSSTIAEVLDFDMCKDFKLSINLKEELSSTGLISKIRDGEEIVYLSFMPEITDTYEDSEKEYLFLIDVSGSMGGNNIEETKKAVKKCLLQLDIGDKFNIVEFESNFKVLSIESLEFNEETLSRAIKYIDNLITRGGTEILSPLKFALYEENTEKTILLFTDGQVGNEEEILEFVENNIGRNRIFPFGIDDNVNASFIHNLAKIGNGKGELIQQNEEIEKKIFRTFERIQTPLLEEIRVEYGNNKLQDEIRENSTIFNYEFYNVFAKIDKLTDNIKLIGKILNNEYQWEIKKENFIQTNVDLELLFAKQEIDRLEKYIKNTNDNEAKNNYINMIIELAVKYNINSNYTSFLTIYERENKILNIPTFEKTTLGNGWLKNKAKQLVDFCSSGFLEYEDDDCMYANMMDTDVISQSYEQHDTVFCCDIPDFIRMNREDYEKIQDIPLYLQDVIKKKDTDYIEEYYLKNMDSDIFDIEEHLLFALYYTADKTEKPYVYYKELLSIINKNKAEIEKNNKLQDLIVYLYHNLLYLDGKSPAFKDDNILKELFEILDRKHKKIALLRLDVEYKFEKKYSKEKISTMIKENNLKENLKEILEYLISYQN